MSFFGMIILVYEDFVASIFIKDPETVAHVKSVLPLLTVYLFFDTIHGVQNGNIRALGKQGPASIITMFCLYGIGLPFALYHGFKMHKNLYGFWEGFLIA